VSARGVRTIGYGFSSESTDEFISASPESENRIQIDSSWGSATVAIAQLGRFNASNALGVLGCLVAYGLPFAQAARLLERLPAVPGRMQQVGERPLAVIDYAHTPDALEKVLSALRPVAEARGGGLTVVFGAGGDRDPGKRAAM